MRGEKLTALALSGAIMVGACSGTPESESPESDVVVEEYGELEQFTESYAESTRQERLSVYGSLAESMEGVVGRVNDYEADELLQFMKNSLVPGEIVQTEDGPEVRPIGNGPFPDNALPAVALVESDLNMLGIGNDESLSNVIYQGNMINDRGYAIFFSDEAYGGNLELLSVNMFHELLHAKDYAETGESFASDDIEQCGINESRALAFHARLLSKLYPYDFNRLPGLAEANFELKWDRGTAVVEFLNTTGQDITVSLAMMEDANPLMKDILGEVYATAIVDYMASQKYPNDREQVVRDYLETGYCVNQE